MFSPRTVVTLLLGVLCANAGAGDLMNVSLRQAIESAMRRNLDIAVVAYEPWISRSAISVAAGRFDPALRSGYSHSEDTRRPLSSVDLRGIGETGVSGLLPLGTEYRFGLQSVTRAGTAGDPASRYSSGLQFGLTQPLLRDFGAGANLFPLRVAQANARISEWTLRQQIIDTVTSVHYIYNNLYFAIRDLEVAKRSRALAQTLMEDNIRRNTIGVMSPLDITTARAEVAARQEAVILAERAVRDNENYLKQLITDDTQALLTSRVEISTPPMAAALKVDVRDAVRDALAMRPDYRQSILDIEKRDITLAYDRNQMLPRLDLNATLNLLGADSGFYDSLGNATSRDQTSWSAGAVFSVPIPNRSGRARVEISKLQAAQAVMDLKRLEQEIIVRVDNAAGQIATTRQRIDSTRESVKLAKESLEAGQERLNAGTSTTFEVLELQKRLAEAEVAELRAQADFNKAVAELDRQTGTTLERNAIQFQPYQAGK